MNYYLEYYKERSEFYEAKVADVMKRYNPGGVSIGFLTFEDWLDYNDINYVPKKDEK